MIFCSAKFAHRRRLPRGYKSAVSVEYMRGVCLLACSVLVVWSLVGVTLPSHSQPPVISRFLRQGLDNLAGSFQAGCPIMRKRMQTFRNNQEQSHRPTTGESKKQRTLLRVNVAFDVELIPFLPYFRGTCAKDLTLLPDHSKLVAP